MFVYNVTSRVEAAIAEPWLSWMLMEHIPQVLATGLFTRHRILRLLDTDETEGQTFAVQYEVETREAYAHYLDTYAPALRAAAQQHWGEGVFSFRTFLEVIN